MKTNESSANSEREYALFSDVEIEVCASTSNKIHNGINERDCVRPKMKPSKRPRDLGNGTLAQRVDQQREATESRRVTELADH